MPISVLRAVLGRMQFTLHAARRIPHGASRLLQAMSAWLVKTRRAPSRHRRDARVYGHTITAMHKLSTPPPPRALLSLFLTSDPRPPLAGFAPSALLVLLSSALAWNEKSLSLRQVSPEVFGSSRLLPQKPYVLLRAALALNSLYWLVRSIRVFGNAHWLVSGMRKVFMARVCVCFVLFLCASFFEVFHASLSARTLANSDFLRMFFVNILRVDACKGLAVAAATAAVGFLFWGCTGFRAGEVAQPSIVHRRNSCVSCGVDVVRHGLPRRRSSAQYQVPRSATHFDKHVS